MRLGRLCGTVLCAVAMLSGGWAKIQEDPQTRTELKEETKRLPHATSYVLSREIGPGRLMKAREGKDGSVKNTYKLLYRNGKLVDRSLVATVRIEPVDAIYRVGKAGYAASRGSYTRSIVKVMHATAYDPSAGRGARATFRTATGERAQYGVAAVDPRVIPLGTMLYIEGYGLALACDTGGAIRGNRIDLCVPTRSDAMRFGRKQVKVHVLSGR